MIAVVGLPEIVKVFGALNTPIRPAGRPAIGAPPATLYSIVAPCAPPPTV